MDTFARPFGSGVPVVICGKTRIMHALTLRDLGTCEQLLLSRRSQPNGHVALGSGLPDAMRETVRSETWSAIRAVSSVTLGALVDWMDTTEGVIYSTWLSLRHDPHDYVDFDELSKEIIEQGVRYQAKLAALRDLASGMDLFAWADWPRSVATGIGNSNDRHRQSWRRIFRAMVTDGMMNPIDAGNLTLYQAQTILCDKDDLGGGTKTIPLPPRRKKEVAS